MSRAIGIAASALLLAAPAVPVSPDNPEVAEEWVNPAVRPGEQEVAKVELVEAPRAISAHDPLRIKLRVTNLSDDTLSGLAVIPRRAPAVGSVGEQRVAAVAGIGEYQVMGEGVSVDKQLPPGESTELELQFGAGELAVGIGTYPMGMQLIDASGATLDTDRFHLSVRGTRDNIRPADLTALYPVAAPVDIVPGETGEAPEDPPLVLKSEQLAGELAPDGRLSKLVDTYIEAAREPAVGYATCMALDPALVDTVERMTRGYTVADERAAVVEEPKRLRDSWGSENVTRGVAGTGAEDAKAWLDKVRQISATGCTIALPWANADLGAVARTGDTWLMREAVERGPFVLQRVLGATGTLNAVVPGTGYVEDGTATSLGWADHSRSTVGEQGMQAAWERSPVEQAPAGADQSALERSVFTETSAAPAPAEPVRVLAAPVDGFGWIAPGVMAVGYQDSLASVLAATGEHPETIGTSNPTLRFDYTQDSKAARDISAASAVRLAVQSQWVSEDQEETAENEQDPILVVPPATWDADTAAAVLGTVAELVTGGAARAMSLGEYLTPKGPVARASASTPYPDPAAYTDAELLQVTQQAAFTNDIAALMVPDPAIALTRYGFTLPLRRDLLTALSVGNRRALSLYDASVATTSDRLAGSRDTLNELRAAVTLIPPGNVYTRTSPSSPLLIVAQNGLPLPVEAAIRYTGTDGARLHLPGTLKIPARGSVTVQMTADLPEEGRGTDLELFLAGGNGQPISQPVGITVRTSALAVNGWVLAGGLGAAGLLFFLLVGLSRRRRAGPRSTDPPIRPARTSHTATHQRERSTT
ncbi:hypothetical protein [Corynebacterium sp. Marseille-P4321]|uniref:hypothetical protein n=1 Tax=Corynebacterium sp. Marseille-P4321 TaxID=2736603 RepID=UPI00158E88CA|nr:hypothetical protein [Corynebacterium sp. Marseille-P4321]